MSASSLCRVALILAATAAISSACSGSDSERPPGTGAAPAESAYHAVDALPKLNFAQMLGLQPIPGDLEHALLLTKDGLIRRVSMTDDAAAPSPFLDLRDRIIKDPGLEEGLLGLAYAPDFASSGAFYVYYTAGNPRRSVIARFKTAGNVADASSEHVLLEIPQPYANHNGGSLAFGPDGDLYIGSGDGGSEYDPQGYGQSTDTLLAKILRIDVSKTDYTIPPDNPFAGVPATAARISGVVTQATKPEIFAYGLRNPWRINFDTATGALWVGDVGQDHWEEVDRVEKGKNYGWSIVEGNNHCHKPSSNCDTTGLTPPRAEYSHDNGCSITGGFVYRGKSMPELTGYYVYSDYCSGNVWAVDTSSDSTPPVLLTKTGLSVSSFGQDKDGELYLVTFGKKIAKLSRK